MIDDATEDQLACIITMGGPVAPTTIEISAGRGMMPGKLKRQFAGMTLLDRFAEKAMEVLLKENHGDLSVDDIAHDAYRQAEAMIKRRGEISIR